ncbi:MAG: cache domain-containing protein [Burkholderiaceae bacterium]|nr:cache domain-containing protein [Burkholderiaceae bacterium]
MMHRRSSLSALCVLAAGALFSGVAFAAGEQGSREEAKALCEAAAAHVKKVGIEQAAKDFATDRARWMPKDLFPFVQEFAGTMRFHINDKLIGKNTLGVKDASGKEFAKQMVEVARSGKPTWVDYEWAHPVTRKVEDKSAYIQRVAGSDMFVGVGVYR